VIVRDLCFDSFVGVLVYVILVSSYFFMWGILIGFVAVEVYAFVF
jgi:hypothetical protein